MTPRDVNSAPNGRRRFDRHGLEARNTQAARDALRRRQKEKKARIVKRHVRYKQKQKLLEQLRLTERPAPIVAAALCRDDDDEIDEIGKDEIKKTKTAKSSLLDEEDIADEKAHDAKSDETKKQDVESNSNSDVGKSTADQSSLKENTKHQEDVSSPQKGGSRRKKYVPFMKEQKEFLKLKEEREAQEKERRKKVEERQEMLRMSKKERRAKAKKIRKVTPRGQPKLKYRLNAMLARIEK